MFNRRQVMKSVAAAAVVGSWPSAPRADEALFDARLLADPLVGLPAAPGLDGLPSAPSPLDDRATSSPLRLPSAPSFSSERYRPGGEKRLHLFNVHTKEEVDVAFFRSGYLDKGIAKLDYFMRDWRAGSVRRMDPRLFDILHGIQASVAPDTPLCLLSGFRTRATNAQLAKVRPSVARHSLHIMGRAADIYVPGCRLETLRDCARALEAGGVGYYPENGFLHVDTGPVRWWS